MTRVAPLGALVLAGCIGVVGTIDGPGERAEEPGCEGSWVASVAGRIVDEGGAPVAEAAAQLCVRGMDDSLSCLTPASSGPDGRFARSVPEDARCVKRLAIRALLPSSPTTSTVYCVPPAPEGSADIQLAAPIVLHELGPPVLLPPMGDPGAPRWVEMSAGLSLELVPDTVRGYEELVGARIEGPTCVIEGHDDIEGLWALGPEGDLGEFGAALRFPAGALSEGAEVELLLLGGLYTELLDGTLVDEAELVPFGTGTVRNGAVESDPGSHLPYLSWLAYRRR